MTDEPENLTLKLLREVREEMRDGFTKVFDDLSEMREGFSELRAEQERLAGIVGKIADAVTAIAVVQEQHSEILGTISEIQANQGARLNVIEGRLAIIEKHTGLVKA
jgi:hypothetical protein